MPRFKGDFESQSQTNKREDSLFWSDWTSQRCSTEEVKYDMIILLYGQVLFGINVMHL